MITKESKTERKCCLYASDFHLEMILLPYIKQRINKSNFVIITQNDLSDTIKVLLDRVNIEKEEKQSILDLKWVATYKEEIEDINKLICDKEHIEIIVNGDCSYIQYINKNLKLLDNKIHIIDCFDLNDKDINISDIKSNYKQFLNTNKI